MPTRRFWIMSDLHFEFHPDGGRGFLRSLPDVEHDFAIIAGDLCGSPDSIEASLRLVARRFESVIYVLGNHECYGGTIAQAAAAAEQACERIEDGEIGHVSLLQTGSRLRVGSLGDDGIRVRGGTLWFPYRKNEPLGCEHHMTDFRVIRGLRDDVDKENRECVRYLEDDVAPGYVVVTHHLPGSSSVHPKYHGDPLNQFFMGGAEHVIARNRPALWVHGHTHESVDYRIGDTRVVCNPYGYHGREVNPKFNPALVVEVEMPR